MREEVLRYPGEHNLVIGTDYGHTDASREGDFIDIFRNDLVANPVKKKILDDNPAGCTGYTHSAQRRRTTVGS